MLIGVFVFVALQTVADLQVPALLAEVTKTAGISGEIGKMIEQGLIALSVVFASITANIVSGFFASHVAARFAKKLRHDVFVQVEHFGVAEFEKFGASSLITRTTNDITQVQQTLFMMLRMMLIAPIMMVGGIIMTAQLNVNLTFVILSAIPVLVLFIALLAKHIIPLFKQMQTNLDDLNLITKESITGIRVVRAFACEESDKTKFAAINSRVANVTTKANQMMGFGMPVVQFVFSITTLVIIWVGMNTIASIADAANVVAILQYSMRIMMSFVMLVMMFILVPRASVCAKRILEVLETPISIGDVPTPQQVPNEVSITFDKVSFKFDDAASHAVQDISFTVNKGEVLAIIGGTGSGKSTIANLIPRFYQASEGNIYFGKTNINNIALDALRAQIALVPQTPVIFNRTIAQNVLYGATDTSPQNLSRALNLAQATEFVKELELKEEYLLSQNGKNLSGGQKQRIAIARAIAKQAKVMIFDDSFSALDYKTDALVRKGLTEVFSECATIIVAQRVSSITNASKILVLEQGLVVGYGSYDELIKSCPAFNEIVSSQSKREED